MGFLKNENETNNEQTSFTKMEVWSIGPEGTSQTQKDIFQGNNKSTLLREMTQHIQEKKAFNCDSSLNPDAPEFIPSYGSGSENNQSLFAVENTVSSRVEVPGRVVIPFPVSPISPVVYPSRFGTPGTVFYLPWYQVPASAIPVMSSNQYGTPGTVYFYNMNEY